MLTRSRSPSSGSRAIGRATGRWTLAVTVAASSESCYETRARAPPQRGLRPQMRPREVQQALDQLAQRYGAARPVESSFAQFSRRASIRRLGVREVRALRLGRRSTSPPGGRTEQQDEPAAQEQRRESQRGRTQPVAPDEYQRPSATHARDVEPHRRALAEPRRGDPRTRGQYQCGDAGVGDADLRNAQLDAAEGCGEQVQPWRGVVRKPSVVGERQDGRGPWANGRGPRG